MPVGIAGNILQYKPDFSKRENYTVNLESNNFKNKLHNVVNATGLDDSGCLGGCLYTNIDNA